MRKKIVQALAMCLLGAATAQASTNVFNFNTDPTQILTVTRAGDNDVQAAFGGVWFPTNGSTLEVVGDQSTNGYFAITQAENGHRAKIVFDDFDNGLVVAGFKFQADVRIGGGSASPADGFSLNYARSTDPAIGNGPFAASPTGEGDLPEEGTQTGLAICFDSWFSGGSDVIGMTIRVDNVIRTNFPLPVLNGACNDPDSMQTGTNDLGVAGLCWQPLYAELTTGGLLHVSYKGVTLLTNYAVNFAPSPGRLIFAGRVGGFNQHQHVDNIRLVTIPSAKPVVGPSIANANGFKFTISDSGAATPATNTITVSLDGTLIVPTSMRQTGNIGGGNGITHVVYQNPSLVLAPGSTHTSIVHFTGASFTGPVDATNIFTVPNYVTFTSADKAPGTVNTTLSGFVGRVNQLPISRYPVNGNGFGNVVGAERQLAGGFIDPATGMPYANVTVGGVSDFTSTDVINWWQNQVQGSASGIFSVDQPAPFNWPDSPIPGINPEANVNTDNVAAEVLTILQLPAGSYEFGVNHDDAYKLSYGSEPRDPFKAKVLASANNNGDTTGIRVVVTNGGFYPVRLLWAESGGGAELEFYFVDFVTGQKILINDLTKSAAIAAYRDTAALTHPFVRSVSPTPNDWAISATNPIVAKFQDGTAGTVTDGSIRLNGQVPTISNAGGETTATLAATLPPGSNTITLVYSTSIGGPFTNTWVANIVSTKSDITIPGDPVVAYQPSGGSSPAGEAVTNVIANNLQKYLNFGTNSAPIPALGFEVVPSVGPTVVTGLRHYAANDATERDPLVVVLEGSNDGGTSWNTIFSGPVVLPEGRNGGAGTNEINRNTQWVSEVEFSNAAGYTSYRWYTTQLRGNPSLMQIAEVELLGVPGVGVLPAKLSILRSGTQLSITSSQEGMLQAAPNFSGWTNVGPVGPVSGPLLVNPTATHLFYRLLIAP